MDVPNSVLQCQTAHTFFYFLFFPNIRQRTNSVISHSLCSGALVLTTLCNYRRMTRMHIHVTCLYAVKQKQSKENRFAGEKDKGAKSWGQLVHYYHPVLCSLPANGQELILCLGPWPGSLATITCDNRRMSLSFAWRPPLRCANRGRLSQFGSKSRWVFWPEMHRCQVWKTLMPSALLDPGGWLEGFVQALGH